MPARTNSLLLLPAMALLPATSSTLAMRFSSASLNRLNATPWPLPASGQRGCGDASWAKSHAASGDAAGGMGAVTVDDAFTALAGLRGIVIAQLKLTDPAALDTSGAAGFGGVVGHRLTLAKAVDLHALGRHAARRGGKNRQERR